MLSCLEQQITIKKINLRRKLKRETQDLRSSINCLRLRERERLLLLSLSYGYNSWLFILTLFSTRYKKNEFFKNSVIAMPQHNLVMLWHAPKLMPRHRMSMPRHAALRFLTGDLHVWHAAAWHRGMDPVSQNPLVPYCGGNLINRPW